MLLQSLDYKRVILNAKFYRSVVKEGAMNEADLLLYDYEVPRIGFGEEERIKKAKELYICIR